MEIALLILGIIAVVMMGVVLAGLFQLSEKLGNTNVHAKTASKGAERIRTDISHLRDALDGFVREQKRQEANKRECPQCEVKRPEEEFDDDYICKTCRYSQ
jgi:hypothetical protein